jgi:uncharacterized protein (TIGR02246 family)
MIGHLNTVVRAVLGIVMLTALAGHSPALAQGNPEADFQKIADAFSAAWAKADPKGIAALHTKDAVRLTGNGEPAIKGAAGIEAAMAAAHAGPYKGTTLTITSNGFTRVTPDVYVGEGTYQIAGGSVPAGTPTAGQYMNTMVRQGGRWLIAASAVMPATK